VATWDAGAGDVQDGIDEQAVGSGDAAVLAGLAGEQGFDPLPVGVRDGMSWSQSGPSLASAMGPGFPNLPICCPHDLERAVLGCCSAFVTIREGKQRPLRLRPRWLDIVVMRGTRATSSSSSNHTRRSTQTSRRTAASAGPASRAGARLH